MRDPNSMIRPEILEPIPLFKGCENERSKSDLLRQQRMDNGYLLTRMSSTLDPLAKALGFRPMSSYRLGHTIPLYHSQEQACNKLNEITKIQHNPTNVGPSELCYVVSSNAAVAEKEWRDKPYPMKYASPRTLALFQSC